MVRDVGSSLDNTLECENCTHTLVVQLFMDEQQDGSPSLEIGPNGSPAL